MFIYGLLFLAWGNFYLVTREQHFVLLADSFINGKLFFLQEPAASGWADTSFFSNHYYWPLGIFPALLLMPFVLFFGTAFLQGYVSLALSLLILAGLFLIAKKVGVTTGAAVVLAFAYVFSTAFIMVAFTPFSWYFAHVVASVCLLFALYFIVARRSPVLVGLFFTFSFLTRISIFLGLPFFILYYFFFDRSKFAKRIVLFSIPVLFGILIFITYNYVRFGNIFETGYKYQLLFPELIANRNIGMWSLRHFPANLYLFLLKGPEIIFSEGTAVVTGIKPSHWGMSFMFTSPILLYAFFANLKNKINLLALSCAGLIAVFLFGSFGLGAYQYGYRFALDFQPFLFLVLCDVFKGRGLSIPEHLLIFGSFIFNVFMVIAYFAIRT